MKNSTYSSFILLSLLVPTTRSAVIHDRDASATTRACQLIKQALPQQVFFPGSTEFDNDIHHFEATSTQNSTCSVEPTSANDVSTILKIVGRSDIRAPFAVKSGGHSTNKGFSSTTGVQIAMSRFRDLQYNSTDEIVHLGPGIKWQEAYAFLEQYNRTVVGARVPGVGVGLALGGGYSWVTNQFGLSVDNILALDIVLPNGTFVIVTEASQPDLFFGLKGGLNNFGIVTRLTLKARPLGVIYGGVINYSADQSDALERVLADFSANNTDVRAQLAAAYIRGDSLTLWQVILFYADGVVPSVYQPFLDIPNLSADIGVRSFSDFLSIISVVSSNSGGISHVVPIVQYTQPIIQAIEENINATYARAVADGRSVVNVLLGLEPFHNAFAHATESAYEHSPNRPVTPCNPWITYSDPADAKYFNTALWNLANSIQAVAIKEGQSRLDDLRYPNYALGDTPLEQMYGDNVARLRRIKKGIDPRNIMGQTGGFKF